MESTIEDLQALLEAGQPLSPEKRTVVTALKEDSASSDEVKALCDKLLALREVETPPEQKITISGGGSLVQLLEAKDASGKEWEVLLIEAGTSKNRHHYDAAVLKGAVSLFEGVDSYADHTNESEQRVRPERSVKDKIGRFSGPAYREGIKLPNGRMTEGITATLKVIPTWARDLLKESVESGEPDFVGFSIDALGKSSPKNVGGKSVRWVESISKVNSVDLVTKPSAGGRVMRLVASDRGTRVDGEEEAPVAMTAEQLAQIVKEQVTAIVQEAFKPMKEKADEQAVELTRLKEAERLGSNRTRYEAALGGAQGLSEKGKERLRASFSETAERRDLGDEEIIEAIKESASYEAHLLQSHMSGPYGTPRVSMGSDTHDKYRLALIGMFENLDQKDADSKEVPRFRTIKEAYCRWAGRDSFEVEPEEIMREFGCKYDSQVDHKKIMESVSRATWGEIYADVLYLQMMKTYRANTAYAAWRQLCSDIENAPDFQTRHWTRVGGYGDLETVAETATYPMLVSPTDEEISYAVAKRGGLDDLTFEAIANDRVGAIRRIPTGMARSAIRTLFKFVMNMVTTNNANVDYDSAALYVAGHSNTNTVALSLTGLQTVTTAMRQQTAYSESLEILGERNRPKYLIVPTALEFVAQRLLSPSDAYLAAIANPSTEQSLDPQAFKGMGMSYIVYDQLTSTTGWYAVADPSEVPTIVMGFLNGREDPEMFVQDQPTVGAQFTADKTTYKVRHIYGGDVQDHRSFYRGNV